MNKKGSLNDWELQYEESNKDPSFKNIMDSRSNLVRTYSFVSSWVMVLFNKANNFVKGKL